MRFISLLAAAGTVSLALAAPTKRALKLQYWGVNESGAEFGSGKYPGVLGTDYTWYDLATYDTFIARGMNLFRLNFATERMAQNGLGGSLDSTYLNALKEQVNYITSKGATAMISPHNYGRYKGAVVTDTASFGTFWKNLAAQFKDNSKVIFDTDNEYNTMSQTLVLGLNQAAINGIRAAGATTQAITVEGNHWSGAWSWTTTRDPTTGKTNGETMGSLTDPSNKLLYQMHQYLDSDSSGTSETCVSSTILAERLVAATNWLRANGKQGFLGEFAGGANPTCIAALKGGLTYLTQNSDVWVGAAYWAAGPWWGDYMFNFEPTSGSAAYSQVLPQLESVIKS